MRYLNKCFFDCSDKICKTEVQGEAIQVLQPFFKTLNTLNTLPGRSKGYDFFHVQLANFGKHQNPTSLYRTDVWSSKVRVKKLLFFCFLWWSKLARLIPAQLLIPLFKIETEEVSAKCECLSLKSRICKKHKNTFHHTALQICSCFNSLRKQKKAQTKYKHDLCFAFVFIANQLDPLGKPFYKLGLRVSSGFLNTRIH